MSRPSILSKTTCKVADGPDTQEKCQKGEDEKEESEEVNPGLVHGIPFPPGKSASGDFDVEKDEPSRGKEQKVC